MPSTRQQKRLVMSATFPLALLIVGMLAVGLAIWQGAVAGPEVDLQIYRLHILAYRTDYPDCPPMTQCPPESVAPPSAFYVVWSINEAGSNDQPDGRRSKARRILLVRLQR